MSRFRGKVVKRPFAVGSKSERDAIMIITATGDYVLRRKGGNPFQDPSLNLLIGKTISGEGILHGYTLIMSKCWVEQE
jgi:hypothetical protein